MAARVLLVIDLLVLIGAILLPLMQDSEGLVSFTLAEYGRPGLAPVTGDGAEAAVRWWVVGTFVALLVQALVVCVALARVLPTWAATLMGVLGTIALGASLVTLAVIALASTVEPGISFGWGALCLAVGQVLFLVVMFAPSLVRGWRS